MPNVADHYSVQFFFLFSAQIRQIPKLANTRKQPRNMSWLGGGCQGYTGLNALVFYREREGVRTFEEKVEQLLCTRVEASGVACARSGA